MNVIECAEILRFKGYKVYCWKPEEGTAEPDIVAMKKGRLYNVYLRKDESREEKVNEFARTHGATVLYMDRRTI